MKVALRWPRPSTEKHGPEDCPNLLLGAVSSRNICPLCLTEATICLMPHDTNSGTQTHKGVVILDTQGKSKTYTAHFPSTIFYFPYFLSRNLPKFPHGLLLLSLSPFVTICPTLDSIPLFDAKASHRLHAYLISQLESNHQGVFWLAVLSTCLLAWLEKSLSIRVCYCGELG